VHWRSTARRGHLVVRQNETRRRAPVLVLLDVRPSAHDRQSFERAVEACASIVTALDRASRPYEMAWSTGTIVGAQGQRHLATVMDELAVVQPHGPERIAIAGTRRRSSALVAVVGSGPAHDAAALGVLVRDGGLMVAVSSGANAPVVARSRRFRVVGIRNDGNFPQAWNEAVLRWQRTGNLHSSDSRARA
jgi:uncharacterized protein (DUF58 family)